MSELTLKLIANRSTNNTILHIDGDRDESIDLFHVFPHTLAVLMTSRSDTRFGEWQCLIQIHFGGEASDTGVFFPKTRMICISLAYLAEKSMDGCTGDGVDVGYNKKRRVNMKNIDGGLLDGQYKLM